MNPSKCQNELNALHWFSSVLMFSLIFDFFLEMVRRDLNEKLIVWQQNLNVWFFFSFFFYEIESIGIFSLIKIIQHNIGGNMEACVIHDFLLPIISDGRILNWHQTRIIKQDLSCLELLLPIFYPSLLLC